MITLLVHSLRQLVSRRLLLLIILLLAAGEVAIAVVVSIMTGDQQVRGEMVDALFDGLMVAAVLPLVMMALATAAFGHEREDRTLSYLVLKPVPRWVIVLPKLLASIVVGGLLVIASGVAATLVLLDGDAQAAAAVGLALSAGVIGYAAIFTWGGLISSSALAFGLVYVLVWEGVVITLLPGVGYLSVRAYTLAIMYGLDDGSFGTFGERAIELPAAVGGTMLVAVAFFLLTVRHLRRLDVQ